MKFVVLLALLIVSWPGTAHELTPTYFELKSSYIESVYRVNLETWNARGDVEYYRIEATDKDWNPVPFLTAKKVFKLEYLQRRKIEVFFPSETSVSYICTKSLLRKGSSQKSIISSKVCSKIK